VQVLRYNTLQPEDIPGDIDCTRETVAEETDDKSGTPFNITKR
jgi:hypothetical protein